MSNDKDDGKPVESAGGQEQSTSATSDQPAQQLPAYVTDILEKLEEQGKQIRGLQKGTDKQIAQTNKQIERILQLQAEGLDQTQIERELMIDAFLSKQGAVEEAPARDTAKPSNVGDTFTASDAINYVERYQLPSNDPDFIALLRQNPTEQQVKDFVLGKLSPQKTASPGGVVQSGSKGQGKGEPSPTDLEAAYQRELTDIVQANQGEAKIRLISELKTKYNALGLSKL